MLVIKDKKYCCGCTACASICPKKCITMTDDVEGISYPIVDNERCVDCGLCESVCPMQHPESDNRIISAYASENRNADIRKQSSSGGLFTAFAAHILEQQGVVCACKMNEDVCAVHDFAWTMEELKPMRCSKYVQSRLEDTFVEIKKMLDDGIQVLFSGMPCQVAGLKRFLRKPYDNLLAIDVLCHGVPSPKLFRDYLRMQEAKFGSRAVAVNFRDKSRSWKLSDIVITFENGQTYTEFCGTDAYLSLFGNNLSQRPSCFACPFTTTHRPGDISIGDFSVIINKVPYEDDDLGVTMVLVNNEKGKAIFDDISDSISLMELSVDTAVTDNAVLNHPLDGIERRNAFYEAYTALGFQKAISKLG